MDVTCRDIVVHHLCNYSRAPVDLHIINYIKSNLCGGRKRYNSTTHDKYSRQTNYQIHIYVGRNRTVRNATWNNTTGVLFSARTSKGGVLTNTCGFQEASFILKSMLLAHRKSSGISIKTDHTYAFGCVPSIHIPSWIWPLTGQRWRHRDNNGIPCTVHSLTLVSQRAYISFPFSDMWINPRYSTLAQFSLVVYGTVELEEDPFLTGTWWMRLTVMNTSLCV
jgi:hypothetical protein